jgi:hypothetical protein
MASQTGTACNFSQAVGRETGTNIPASPAWIEGISSILRDDRTIKAGMTDERGGEFFAGEVAVLQLTRALMTHYW